MTEAHTQVASVSSSVIFCAGSRRIAQTCQRRLKFLFRTVVILDQDRVHRHGLLSGRCRTHRRAVVGIDQTRLERSLQVPRYRQASSFNRPATTLHPQFQTRRRGNGSCSFLYQALERKRLAHTRNRNSTNQLERFASIQWALSLYRISDTAKAVTRDHAKVLCISPTVVTECLAGQTASARRSADPDDR